MNKRQALSSLDIPSLKKRKTENLTNMLYEESTPIPPPYCDDTSEEQEEICTPQDLAIIANKVNEELLPDSSKDLYLKEYNRFKNWCKEKKCPNYLSSSIIESYFKELSEQYVPSTLWSKFSMLKKTLLIFDKFELTNWNKISQWLKNQDKYHKRKKATTFSRQEIDLFLEQAPDDSYFIHKLAFLIGLYGGLRIGELGLLNFEDIEEVSNGLRIIIRRSKTDQAGEGNVFIIPPDKTPSRCAVKYYRQYLSKISFKKTGRFFHQYRNKKVTRQNLGKSWFQQLPKTIAKWLQIPNWENYTGHSIRRTAATWVADAGVTKIQMKRHFRWKSESMVDEYVDNSEIGMKHIANAIQGDNTHNPVEKSEDIIVTTTQPNFLQNVTFTNCTNVSINVFTKK
jgi:integrase